MFGCLFADLVELVGWVCLLCVWLWVISGVLVCEFWGGECL